jgi:hypothetical protein
MEDRWKEALMQQGPALVAGWLWCSDPTTNTIKGSRPRSNSTSIFAGSDLIAVRTLNRAW